MSIDWRTCIALALVMTLAGCGSYSAPNNNNNTSMSPDSTGDTTMTSPNYSRN